MIRKATYSDIESILSLTKACAKDMKNKGILQWNDLYPSAEVFAQDIEREELYILTDNSQIFGTIVISSLMDAEYIPIKWLTPNNHNMYIHRLAVHPEYQGLGLAQNLMDFAETFARTHQYNSIRLDTFSQNQKNQKFYELRNYMRLGSIFFPKQSEHPFYCYELIL